MASLRELIYGSQLSQTDEITPSHDEEDETYMNNMINYKPLGQVYSSLPKKRKSIPLYSKFPENSSKRTQIFPPGCFSFQKFQQYDRPPQGVNREILRSLWHQACYGGDLDAAVRILVTMIQVDSIDFSDFHQFLLLLRSYSNITLSTSSSIAFTVMSLKITSSRSQTIKSLLEMFLEIIITHPEANQQSSNVVNKALDFINRYILYPSVTGDYALESMLTLLYCLQAIELCRNLVVETRPVLPSLPTLTERYSHNRARKHHRTLLTTLLLEANLEKVDDLAPTCAKICSHPLLFSQTIATLRLYEAKYTKKFGVDRRVEIRKILQDICTHFQRVLRLQEDKSSVSVDFTLLYAAYLYGSKNISEANELFLAQHIQTSQRGQRTYLHYLSLTSAPDQRRVITAARLYLFAHVNLTHDDLLCACHLYWLGQLSDSEFIFLLANSLEKSVSTNLRLKKGQKRSSGNINVIFSTNIDISHHSLWANLANVLGPWHSSKKSSSSMDVHTLFEHIGSEKLKAEYALLSSRPVAPITLDYIRTKTFDIQYFETASKHQCHFNDLFDENNPSPQEPSLSQESATRDTSIPISPPASFVDIFRSERKWWAESGQIFSSSFLGEELSWNVMEFVAERMVLTALRRHGHLHEALTINDISNLSYDEAILEMTKMKTEFSISLKQEVDTPTANQDISGDEDSDLDSDDSSELSSQSSSSSDAWGTEANSASINPSYSDSSDDEIQQSTSTQLNDISPSAETELENQNPQQNTPLIPGSLWENFLSWCQFKSSPRSFPVPSDEEISSDELGPFDVRKAQYDVTSATPLWTLLGRVCSLKSYSHGPTEKIIHYLLGEKLLEMITYQILVYCHLTESLADVWICRAVQVLIQQGETNPVAIRCLAYLISMGVDIMEIVRNGNILRGLGVDIHVKSPEMIDVPNEEILYCTSNSSYVPL